MIVEYIEKLHQREPLSYRELCEREGLCYTTFMRWRERARAGEALVSRPGPSKVQPPDWEALREDLRTLNHGRKRSGGAGDLHRKYGASISRRDLNEMVREERERKKRERNRVFNQVRWLAPRLIWAMDDTEYHPDKRYPKAYVHAIQDLGSRYKLEPIVGARLAHGDEIAAHLTDLFKTHGAPLFIKRDNGSNLNHREVDEVLQEFLVIPVNSPCAYPQYNGGIERAQGELKGRLASRPDQPHAFLAIQAEMDLHAINHRPRRSLRNRTPCDVFRSGLSEARSWNRRKRKEAYETIKAKTLELAETERYDGNAAWRMAVEIWLLEHEFITVSKTG